MDGRPVRFRERDSMGHNVSTIIAITSVATVSVFGSAGCGSKKQATDGPPVAEMGNTINDGTFGATETRDCADGKSLNIGGSGNILTVTGRCDSVIVGGDDNKITFETIDTELIVAGLNNTITYRDGVPQVQDLGDGNSITKN